MSDGSECFGAFFIAADDLNFPVLIHMIMEIMDMIVWFWPWVLILEVVFGQQIGAINTCLTEKGILPAEVTTKVENILYLQLGAAGATWVGLLFSPIFVYTGPVWSWFWYAVGWTRLVANIMGLIDITGTL